jgi:hypothetical protein
MSSRLHDKLKNCALYGGLASSLLATTTVAVLAFWLNLSLPPPMLVIVPASCCLFVGVGYGATVMERYDSTQRHSDLREKPSLQLLYQEFPSGLFNWKQAAVHLICGLLLYVVLMIIINHYVRVTTTDCLTGLSIVVLAVLVRLFLLEGGLIAMMCYMVIPSVPKASALAFSVSLVLVSASASLVIWYAQWQSSLPRLFIIVVLLGLHVAVYYTAYKTTRSRAV